MRHTWIQGELKLLVSHMYDCVALANIIRFFSTKTLKPWPVLNLVNLSVNKYFVTVEYESVCNEMSAFGLAFSTSCLHEDQVGQALATLEITRLEAGSALPKSVSRAHLKDSKDTNNQIEARRHGW